MNKIAVLITCHNRQSVTLACLFRLFAYRNDLDVYCVDDNSSDGTPEAISCQYPQVHLYEGDGNLFWCRGMRRAWVEARKHNDYDFYIWLNDDMTLYPNAFDEILECSKMHEDKAIISGLVQEETTKVAIYGGFDETQKIISANGKNNPIYRLNGNFVIIPKYVFEKIGYFDEIYHHDIGDVDYGFTAHKLGIPVVSTRCYIGSTKAELKRDSLRIRKNGTNIFKRFRGLYSPLGAPPRINYHLIKKHHGAGKALAYYLYLHVINIMPDWCWRKLYNGLYNS